MQSDDLRTGVVIHFILVLNMTSRFVNLPSVPESTPDLHRQNCFQCNCSIDIWRDIIVKFYLQALIGHSSETETVDRLYFDIKIILKKIKIWILDDDDDDEDYEDVSLSKDKDDSKGGITFQLEPVRGITKIISFFFVRCLTVCRIYSCKLKRAGKY